MVARSSARNTSRVHYFTFDPVKPWCGTPTLAKRILLDLEGE
jgi:predicted PhzF superfamily epimerase YddE/YHI9